MRILVVDDDRAVRDALRRALTLGSYEVQVAEDGERSADLLLGRPHPLQGDAVVVVRAVAEVEAKDIHPDPRQLADHRRGVAGRPQGGDNAGPALADHGR